MFFIAYFYILQDQGIFRLTQILVSSLISVSSASEAFKWAEIPDQIETLVCRVSFRGFLSHIVIVWKLELVGLTRTPLVAFKNSLKLHLP